MEPLLAPASDDGEQQQPAAKKAGGKRGLGFAVASSAAASNPEEKRRRVGMLTPDDGREGSPLLSLAALAASTGSVNGDIGNHSNGSGNRPGPMPRTNDVLSGPSHTAFHHIGNRRFRVLVEANLGNYFGDDIAVGDGDDRVFESQYGDPRSRAVGTVVGCVEGNHPPGRFLERTEDDHRRTGEPSTDDDDGGGLRLASGEDARSRVHATFLAAGRFHDKQNAALMAAVLRRGLELYLQEQEAPRRGATSQGGPPKTVAAMEAEWDTGDDDWNEGAGGENGASGRALPFGDLANDAISDALPNYHAKRQRAAAERSAGDGFEAPKSGHRQGPRRVLQTSRPMRSPPARRFPTRGRGRNATLGSPRRPTSSRAVFT